ncbi:MAG: hypothetical protein WC670_05330 [Pseudolabrys sp.]|jgi:hypothetical protein
METFMRQLGLLLVVNEPPATMEEELNAWYDTEHIPERLSIDGFMSASRHMSTTRARRYLALYDLTEVAVLQSAGYMAFVGERFTPWTRRILSRTKVTRIEAVQTYPGDALLVAAPRHLILRWSGVGDGALADIEAGAKRCFLGKPGVTQLRVFAGSGADAGSAFAIVAGTTKLETLLDSDASNGLAKHLGVIESYAPY